MAHVRHRFWEDCGSGTSGRGRGSDVVEVGGQNSATGSQFLGSGVFLCFRSLKHLARLYIQDQAHTKGSPPLDLPNLFNPEQAKRTILKDRCTLARVQST